MFSLQKQIIWAKLESTINTDAAPAATDAILCGEISISPLEGGQVERGIMLPYFGSYGPIRIENYVKISFQTEVAGSGTAGTAPKFASLLKACNMSETISTVVSATAQAGGSTSTIKLAAGASAIDDFYTGMSIAITGGSGVSAIPREIISYSGTTKIATITGVFAAATDATSAYSIGANVIYTPNSNVAPATLTGATIHWYNDGIRHVLLGARGTVKVDLTAKKEPMFSWEFTGLLGTISDTAYPTADFTGWQVPVTVSTANTTDINFLGVVTPTLVMEKFLLDIGNKITYRQLVGQENVLITDRNTTGTIGFEEMSIATKDYFTMAKNSVTGQISIKHGQTAGNIFGVTGRSVQPVNPKKYNLDDISMLELGLEYAPFSISGNDEFRLCFK